MQKIRCTRDHTMLYYVSDELIMRHILVSVFTEDRRYDAEFRKRGGVI